METTNKNENTLMSSSWCENGVTEMKDVCDKVENMLMSANWCENGKF